MIDINNSWALYLALNMEFVKNIVIKNPYVANAINKDIETRYGTGSVDYNFPETWKYYQNLSGQYHFSDTVIKITSLDTLEIIDFTKENLAIHSNTKANYQPGSRYYKLLVENHPGNETLINGILNPIDMNVLVTAEDFTIVYFPMWLVEEQEHTLIYRLQQRCKAITTKWDNYRYDSTDDYFMMAYMVNVQLALLPILLNLRLEMCGTNEAHSFHITNFLASHGRLDKYMPYMTLKQILYFYRNIRYIERNVGKQATFEELIKILLTERQIPISEYSVRQLNRFTDEFLPQIQVRRKPLNALFNIPEKDYFNFSEMPAKEANTAPNNTLYYDDHYAPIERGFMLSGSSVVQTKDLESNMVDLSGCWPDPLETVLLREWTYLAYTGRYNAMITFKDPVAFETRTLSALDANIYLQYLAYTQAGAVINKVPTVASVRHRRVRKPTVDEIIDVAVPRHFFDRRGIAEDLISRHPVVTTYPSTYGFFNYAYKVYLQRRYEWFLTSSQHELYTRGEVETMCMLFYATTELANPYMGQSMDSWLSERSLPKYDYTPEQSTSLMLAIYHAGTGYNPSDAKSPANIQKAMIAIFKQLTSYTIQFITNVNKIDVIPLNWAALRFSEAKVKMEIEELAPIGLDIDEVQGKLNNLVNMDLDSETGNMVVEFKHTTSYEQKEMLDLMALQVHEGKIEFVIDPLHMEYDHDPEEILNTLTNEQRVALSAKLMEAMK